MGVVYVPAAAWRGGGAARPVRSEWQLDGRVRAARSRDERKDTANHCQTGGAGNVLAQCPTRSLAGS